MEGQVKSEDWVAGEQKGEENGGRSEEHEYDEKESSVEFLPETVAGNLMAVAHPPGFLQSSDPSCIVLYKAHTWRLNTCKTKALCPNCKAEVECNGGNTRYLWRHLKACDRDAYDQAQGGCGNSEEASSGNGLRRPESASTVEGRTKSDLLNAVVGYIILEQQPYDVVESPLFKGLFKSLLSAVSGRNYECPSRDEVVTRVGLSATTAVKKIRETLKGTRPAIATGSWTASDGTLYMAITAQFIKEGDTEVTATTLSCEAWLDSIAAESVAQRLAACMEKYDIAKTAVTLTTDRGLNMKKAGTQLLPQEWHGCAALSIEDAIKPVLTEPSVRNTLVKHKGVAAHLHASTRTAARLKELQRRSAKPQNEMPLSCATSWTSIYNQVAFAQKYRPEIESTLKYAGGFPGGPGVGYSQRDWDNTGAIVRLLKIVRDCATVLQREDIANSMVPMLSSVLHKFITRKDTSDLPDHVRKAAVKMFNIFGDRFKVCTDASKIAAFLDPRSKELTWASKCEKKAICKLVATAAFDAATRSAAEKAALEKEEHTSGGNDASGSMEVDVDEQQGDKLDGGDDDEGSLLLARLLDDAACTTDKSGSGAAAAGISSDENDPGKIATRRMLAECEVLQFEAETPLKVSSSSRQVLEWWLERRQIFPALYRVVCVYFAVPATSASTERLFSIAGNIMDEPSSSSRCSPENFDHLVFLHGCHGVGWQLGDDVKAR